MFTPGFSEVLFTQSLVFCEVFCLIFVIFLLAIVLSVLLRLTASDLHFGII